MSLTRVKPTTISTSSLLGTGAGKTVFSRLMEQKHILKTYRANDASSYKDPVAARYPAIKEVDRQLSVRTSRRGHASASSWPSVVNGFEHRTVNAGTPAYPFLSKMHPNFVNSTGDFCYLCGTAIVGGKDHHLSFNRDHNALNFFFFLACSMRRDGYSAQNVLKRSSDLFPGLWHRCVSPPLRFAKDLDTLAAVAAASAAPPTASSSSSSSPGSGSNNNSAGSSQTRLRNLFASAAAATSAANSFSSTLTSSGGPAGAGAGGGAGFFSPYMPKTAEQQHAQTQQERALISQQAALSFSSPECIKRALTSASGTSSSSSPRLTRAEAELLMSGISGNLATQFSPSWWLLHSLHERRIELQAMLTLIMSHHHQEEKTAAGIMKMMTEKERESQQYQQGKETEQDENEGELEEREELCLLMNDCFTGIATRTLSGELPGGIVGQGEKIFRADVMNVVASVLPVLAPNVMAAFSQKAFGRTNLSRLYDSLHIAKIADLLGKPIVPPRRDRSEKSYFLRQLITELHHFSGQQEIGTGNGKRISSGASTERSTSRRTRREEERAELRAQLADMVLTRLASEAVLTISHIYMDRAFRVAALCGLPDANELDAIDFG